MARRSQWGAAFSVLGWFASSGGLTSPSAMAGSGIDVLCREIDREQAEKMFADDRKRLEQKHIEITHMEARFMKVFGKPAAALKEYLKGIPPGKRDLLTKYVALKKDRVDLSSMEDAKSYQDLEDYLKKRVSDVRESQGFDKSSCLYPDAPCSSDGNDKKSVESTRAYQMIQPQFYLMGKPGVYACNYEYQYSTHPLSNEELEALRREDAELASHIAADLGWKNSCIRVPLDSEGKEAVFDTKLFAKRLATALWRAKRTQELKKMAAYYDDERRGIGCEVEGEVPEEAIATGSGGAAEGDLEIEMESDSATAGAAR